MLRFISIALAGGGLVLGGCTATLQYDVGASIVLPADALEEVGPGSVVLTLEREGDWLLEREVVAEVEEITGEDLSFGYEISGELACEVGFLTAQATFVSGDLWSSEGARQLLASRKQPILQQSTNCADRVAEVSLRLR